MIWNKPLDKIFLKVDKPVVPELEKQTNWINVFEIAMVTKRTKGNEVYVQILWASGKTSNLHSSDAKVFLEQWEDKPNA